MREEKQSCERREEGRQKKKRDEINWRGEAAMVIVAAST